MNPDQEELLNSHIQRLSSTIEGRAFIWYILELCGVNSNPFNPDNSAMTSFNAGMLQVGIEVRNRLHLIDPQIYINLLTKFAQEDNIFQDSTEEELDYA